MSIPLMLPSKLAMLSTTEEKAALHWEASQDLYKPTTRMPEGLPTNREEQVALVEAWLIREQLRRGDLVY